MRYVTFLMTGVVEDQSEIDEFVKEFTPIAKTGVKYIYSRGSVILHFDSDEEFDDIKFLLSDLCEEYFYTYLLTPFPDRLSVNLSQLDCVHLFDLNSTVSFTDTTETARLWSKPEEEDEDEEEEYDMDLINTLKEKFSVKRVEPTLDEILEKIHKKGLTSLSVQERGILNSFN